MNSKTGDHGEIPSWVSGLLDRADMIGPVSHDLKNVLNNIVLQSATLERVVPEEYRERITAFRSLASAAGQMLAKLDSFRHDLSAFFEKVDLGDAAEHAVERARQHGLNAEVHLERPLPGVKGNSIDLARLLNLLIVTGHGNGDSVALRVVAEDRHVLVQVEDVEPPALPERLSAFCEPSGAGRNGRNSLEVAAASMIARRLGTTLEARNQPGQGVVVAFKLLSWDEAIDPKKKI